MDTNSIKEMVMNLTNELTVIKILDPSIADDVDGPSNRPPTREQIKKAFNTYFSTKSRPLPVEFFKEEYCAMLDEELRERRKLLHDKLYKSSKMTAKKSMAKRMSRYSQVARPALTSPNAPTQPSPTIPTTEPKTEDYRTKFYGNLGRTLYKVNHITWFVTDAIRNSTYSVENLSSVDSFTIDNRKLLKTFNLLKTELDVVHRSMVDVINQLVQIHKSVPQVYESIAKETRKRYKSEEIYLNDGSTIIVNNNEKHYISQLNTEINNFLERKTELIKILEKMTSLVRSYIVYENELDVKFMEYFMNFSPPQEKDTAELQSATSLTIDTMVSNIAKQKHNIQSCKIFKNFPSIGNLPDTTKDQ